MLHFRNLFRVRFSQSSISQQFCKLSTSPNNSDKKDPTKGENCKDDEKSSIIKVVDSSDKINDLVNSIDDVDKELPTSLNTELARPKQRKVARDSKTNETGEPTQTAALVNAAKEVAKSLGGDVKQTEAQLLSKATLKEGASSSSSTSSSSGSSSSGDSSSSSDDEASLPGKGAPASSSVGPVKMGAPKSQLEGDPPQKFPMSLSELIVGMKIDRSVKPQVPGRATQVRKVLGAHSKGEDLPWKERERPQNNVKRGNDDRRDYRSKSVDHRQDDGRMYTRNRDTRSTVATMTHMSVKLFGKERLGIFDIEKPLPQQADNLATWRSLMKREARLAATHPPANYFEEMILWTEQGKLWKFPIDNEQGLEDEKKVYFAEHVFLEGHLEPWCPRKGPVRHFMELVCVGLSKNPYLTAREKRENIEWFRDYFEKKQDILRETGALGDGESTQASITAA